jgi:Protein of unknown function (DUF3017)
VTRPAQEPATARTQRQWPLLIVVLGVAAGLGIAIVGEDTWRLGSLIIGAFLGIAAVTRFVLPGGEAGLLQVRSKVFDVAVLGFASLAIIALAIVVPSGR